MRIPAVRCPRNITLSRYNSILQPIQLSVSSEPAIVIMALAFVLLSAKALSRPTKCSTGFSSPFWSPSFSMWTSLILTASGCGRSSALKKREGNILLNFNPIFLSFSVYNSCSTFQVFDSDGDGGCPHPLRTRDGEENGGLRGLGIGSFLKRVRGGVDIFRDHLGRSAQFP